MALSRNPQHVTDELWYYEEKKRINIVHEIRVNERFVRTDLIMIPWKKIRTSLKRKDAK